MDKDIKATDLDIFLDSSDYDDDNNNGYIIDDDLDIYKLDKEEVKRCPFCIHALQVVDYINAINDIDKELPLFIGFNNSNKNIFKKYFYAAYNDCLDAGIPIENGGNIGIIEYFNQPDSNNDDVTMYTTHRNLDTDDDDYVLMYKICCFKGPLNNMIKQLGNSVIQMYFAHELIHTATDIEENHGPTFVNYVNKIIEYGNNKYGKKNIYNYMINTFEENDDIVEFE